MLQKWLRKISYGASPELDNTFLFSTPLLPFAILTSYAGFVLHFGPKWMQDRKPFNLKYVIVAYNLMQVCFNAYMVEEFIRVRFSWNLEQNLGCAVKLEGFEKFLFEAQHARGYKLYVFNKILDLVDTVFFVLTKKQSHVTFLHVHHHVVMVAGSWLFGKYFMTGEADFMAFCNIIVHTIMYFYFFLAALGPAYKKYLWWKKYLTQIQIIQFVAIVVVNLIALNKCGSNINYGLGLFVIGEAMINFCLFAKFYKKSYKNTERKEK